MKIAIVVSVRIVGESCFAEENILGIWHFKTIWSKRQDVAISNCSAMRREMEMGARNCRISSLRDQYVGVFGPIEQFNMYYVSPRDETKYICFLWLLLERVKF